MGLNYIALAGEVISSPEKKHTPDGQPVTSFNMVVSLSEEDDSKSGVIKVSAVKKLADKVMFSVRPGDTVFVEGKLYTKTLENRFSQKQKVPYIHATNIEVIKSKIQNSVDYISEHQPIENLNQNHTNNSDEEDIPF